VTLRQYRRPLAIAAFLVVTVAIVLASRRIGWTHALELTATARPGWMLAGIAGNALILLCWTAYWRALRPGGEVPVSFRRMLEIVAASSSLMNTLPYGGGHASSLVLLIRRGAMTRRGALSLLALDQLGEGLAKMSIFVSVALLVPLPTWMRAGVITVAAAVSVWLVTLGVAARYAEELAILKSWRKSGAALAGVLAMKIVQAAAIFAVQRAFGVDLTAGGTLLVFAAITLGTMIPVAPGNLGTFEASAFVAYRYLGLPADQALSLAIMQHVCFMVPSVGIGYLFFSAQTLSRSVMASR
jgi:uncharacterized membrane protein YbhN (UPF0104 family)